jgi:carboxylesterase type B
MQNLSPSAISSTESCSFEFQLIQKSLPVTEFPQSETECLNLNITAPEEALNGAPGIPVFVFIHGGGFATGSNAWPQYDQRRLVQLSRDLGTPVIGVGIKYFPSMSLFQ